MHATTMKIIHWIWGEPKLADFLRKIAEGDDFEYGDDELLEMISSFVFPENRERGIRAWIDIHGNEVERITSPADGVFVRSTTLSTVAAAERVATVALLG